MTNDWPGGGFIADDPFGIDPTPTHLPPESPPRQTYTPTHAWSANEQSDGYGTGYSTQPPPHSWRKTDYNGFTSTSLWEYCKRAMLLFLLIFIVFCMIAFIIGMIAGIAGAL